MQENYIEFKKQRDFGEILGDTFGFLRNEFKPFMSAIISICGPFLVALLFSMGFYTYTAGDIAIFDPFEEDPFVFSSPLLFFIAFLAYMLSAITAYIFIIGTTLFYIKSYIDNHGEVSREEVRSNMNSAFWSLFGLSILKSLTIFFAILLCFLPVLYAIIPMAVVFSIYVFEPRKTVTEAYSDGFYLVNQDFWLAWGSFIVLGIIYYVVTVVFSIPAIIYSFIKVGISASEIDPANIDHFTDPFYILLNVLSSLVQFLLNIVMIIGGAIIYFHLNEKKNFTGTFERIGRIGENLDQ